MTVGASTDFVGICTQSVVVYGPSTGLRTLTGFHTRSAQGSTFSAHVAAVNSRVRDAAGETVEVVTKAWVLSTDPDEITLRHRVVLPDGSSPPLARVDYAYSTAGPHHAVLQFGV